MEKLDLVSNLKIKTKVILKKKKLVLQTKFKVLLFRR